MPLLVLSPARIAAEGRQTEERAADERDWRRRAASLHFTGDHAQIALCAGLLIGNAGPLALAYLFWARENG